MAGATGARVPAELRPPTDKTFFKLALRRPGSDLEYLVEHLKKEFGIAHLADTSVELVLAYLYEECLLEDDYPQSQALWRFLRLYRHTILQSVEHLKGTEGDGFYGVLHEIITADPEAEITVITFNHNLQVEKALTSLSKELAKGKLRFDLKSAYSIKFHQVMPRREESASFPCDGEHGTQVLKPHGSLNWVFVEKMRGNPLLLLRDNLELLYLDPHCNPVTGLVVSTGKGPSGESWPVVIPPLSHKSDLYPALLRPVQERSEEALSTAERLVIFGYSFPDADYSARRWIQRALHLKRGSAGSGAH